MQDCKRPKVYNDDSVCLLSTKIELTDAAKCIFSQSDEFDQQLLHLHGQQQPEHPCTDGNTASDGFDELSRGETGPRQDVPMPAPLVDEAVRHIILASFGHESVFVLPKSAETLDLVKVPCPSMLLVLFHL